MSNPSKDKGTRFETAVTDYLGWALDDERIQRLTLHGPADVGDIGNVYYEGLRVVIECKATRRPCYSRHWQECLVEMGNADANWGAVVWKRPRIGITTRDNVGRHLAYMRRDVFHAMTSNLEPEQRERVERELTERIPRNDDLIGMSLHDYALMLNHWLPLGPDNER